MIHWLFIYVNVVIVCFCYFFLLVDIFLSLLLVAKPNFLANTYLNKAKEKFVYWQIMPKGKNIISEFSDNLCPRKLQNFYVLHIHINSTPIGLHTYHCSHRIFRQLLHLSNLQRWRIPSHYLLVFDLKT